MRYKYQLDNLNCAHCAGKIEAKIAETDGFEDVSFNFATKLLNFKSEPCFRDSGNLRQH
jgi:Cd2+/Zn2+-exporting ATPase